MNKSNFCYVCEKKGKIPIYYRDDQNVHKVAFYVCKFCIHFSGFVDTWNHGPNRTMPYYNNMHGLVRMVLEKKIRISSMKKTQYNYCHKCKKDDYFRLFVRKREKKSYDFIGFICKNCRTCFFINNTSVIKFRTRSNSSNLMVSCGVASAEDEEKPLPEQVSILVNKIDISRLKKAKIQFEYAI